PVPTEGFHKLVYEKRCLTCHNIRGEGGTFAPPWDPEGSKLKASWVANFLQTPDIIRPILQQMPKLGITEEEAKSAVDFIESNFTMPPFGITEKEAQIAKDYIKESFVVGDVPTDLFKEGEVNETRAEKGKKFYDEYGCNACHAIGPVGGVIGPSLTNAGDRLEPNWVYWHLKNSRHAALDTVEPLFKLTDAEITNLVHFLMTCTKKGTS
ncbi:MAG: c-type cytochrome, partial [Candidatus Brocadiales bacterium]